MGEEGEGQTAGNVVDETVNNENNENSQTLTEDANATVENPEIIISEVLCYMFCFMNRAAPENVVKLASLKFSKEHILEAKNLLWKSSVRDALPKYENRRSSTARTESEANLKDISSALTILDRGEHQVKFVAEDLKVIVDYSPEDINELALLKRIASLEKKFDLLEDSVSLNTIEREKLEKKIDDTSALVNTHEHLIVDRMNDDDADNKSHPPDCAEDEDDANSESDSTSDEDDEDDETENEDIPVSTDEPAATNTASAGDSAQSSESDSGRASTSDAQHGANTHSGDSVGPSSSHNTQKRYPNAQKRSYKQAVTDGRQRGGDTRVQQRGGLLPASGIQKTHKVNTRREMSGRQARGLQAAQRGTKSSSGISSADDQGFQVPRYNRMKPQRKGNQSVRKVFLGNISNEHNVDEVFNDISKRLHIPVLGLYQSSHPHARRKSFVLSVPQSKFAFLTNRKNWQDGIVIREFKERYSQTS